MSCDIDKLRLCLHWQLDLNAQLETLEHLEKCEPCFEYVYRLCKDEKVPPFGGPGRVRLWRHGPRWRF